MPADPPRTPAECGFRLVSGAVLREFRLLRKSQSKLHYLRLIEEWCADLKRELGPQLYQDATKGTGS